MPSSNCSRQAYIDRLVFLALLALLTHAAPGFFDSFLLVQRFRALFEVTEHVLPFSCGSAWTVILTFRKLVGPD
jgi:hypothetical protein